MSIVNLPWNVHFGWPGAKAQKSLYLLIFLVRSRLPVFGTYREGSVVKRYFSDVSQPGSRLNSSSNEPLRSLNWELHSTYNFVLSFLSQ